MRTYFLTVLALCIVLISGVFALDENASASIVLNNFATEMPLWILMIYAVIIGALVLGLVGLVLGFIRAQKADIARVEAEGWRVAPTSPTDSTLARAEIENASMLLIKTLTHIAAADTKKAEESLDELRKVVDADALIDLLKIKIYESEKNFDKVEEISDKLSENPDLKLASLKSLMEAQIEKKEYKKALATVNKAYELRQDLYWVISGAFKMRAQTDDWTGALDVLEEGYKKGLVSDEKYVNYKSTVLYQIALIYKEEKDDLNFFKYCKQAVDICPTLVPAVLDLAQYYVDHDHQVRNAEDILNAAWRLNPTSEIAEAYLDLYKDETPLQKVQRMEKWAVVNNQRPSLNNILLAELNIKAELWNKAKSEFEIFLINNPSTKKLARLIAEYEEKANKDEKAAQSWREKAPECQSDAVWMCEECRHVSAKWLPICKKCGAVGHYSWRLYKRQK